MPCDSSTQSEVRHRRHVRSLLLACLAVAGLAGGKASAATHPQAGCSAFALAFSEALEPVVEAVTDGRPNKVQPAAIRAKAWWAANRAYFAEPAAMDSAMIALEALAADHRAPLAARSAVVTSTAALDACTASPTVGVRLMRIDLAAMAGWLRAHGVNTPFPRDVEQAAQEISSSLRMSGHAALADRFTKEVAAALAIPVRWNGNVNAANALLESVDEVEQVL